MEMQPWILINNYPPRKDMSLYPRWRLVLSPKKQAPLTLGFLPVSDNAKDDEMGRELVHIISACGDPDLEWFTRSGPPHSVISLHLSNVGREVPMGRTLQKS